MNEKRQFQPGRYVDSLYEKKDSVSKICTAAIKTILIRTREASFLLKKGLGLLRDLRDKIPYS